MPRARSEHYVDNKKLHEEMVKYLDAVKEAEESDSDKPKIPEYIGECLLKISTRLSTKPNFINVLEGKLNFLKMVKGENDSTYLKLKDRLVKLIGNSEFDIDEILKVWETDGLDKAFKIFSKENNGNKK